MNPIQFDPKNLQPNPKKKGQSFVEFALILPFLLVLVAALIDLGWMYLTMVSLREAAQEAASYAAVCPNDTTGIRERLRSSSTDPIDLSVSSIPDSDITICVLSPSSTTCPSPATAAAIGQDIRVTVTFNHKIITPFVGSFIGNQEYPMSSSARNQILRVPPDPLNLFACDH